MAKQVQKQKATPQETASVEDVQVPAQTEAEKLKAEADALLDEIDSVLEVNAEEFVAAYIQKGGQ